MIICLEHLSNKENLMLMKNLFPSRVIVCVITLLTLTFPVFAQTTNATDEYEETLKKMMKLSGASAATDDLYPKMLSVMKLNAPGKMMPTGTILLTPYARQAFMMWRS